MVRTNFRRRSCVGSISQSWRGRGHRPRTVGAIYGGHAADVQGWPVHTSCPALASVEQELISTTGDRLPDSCAAIKLYQRALTTRGVVEPGRRGTTGRVGADRYRAFRGQTN